VLDKSTLDQLPRVLAADAEVIIELNTSRKPYQFGRLGFELAALALPVVRRAELVGFLAVSAKTDRTLYRPDEIETLVRTVQQVSSDLYALQLEHFQQRSQELEQEVDALREELRSFGPPSTSLAKTP
jgi:GAF domain-containing protein